MPSPRVPVEHEQRAYLACDSILDHDHPAVRELAASLRAADDCAATTARRCFEYVRDRIEHSADYQRSPTTCAASEVAIAGTGFCYAKSHLLVALLRANGLPAGLCYQRLTTEGAGPPYCLHGLVAVWLEEHGWYAMDARGNKAGIDAAFAPPGEQLAFPLVHEGERDFEGIYARPLDAVVACLRTHATWDAVLANLPDLEELRHDV